VVLRGISPAQAALYHDLRFGLAERLSTAAQLSAACDDPQIADCVFAQAVAAAREADIARRGLWRRTRATAGALVLGVALCAVLALVSPPGSARVSADALDEVRDRYHVLTPQEKQQLVAALRRLAERVEADPELRRMLLAAAQAAQKDDRAEQTMAELQEAVASAEDAEAARIAREILQAVGLRPPDGEGGPGKSAVASKGGGTSDPIAELAAADANSSDKPLAARTLVYSPLPPAAGDANSPSAPAAVAARPFVTYADAWTRARARAAEAVRTESVPAQYRDLVRRFFELER